MPTTRILIVEDDPDILKLLSYNIQSAGYDVVTAVDGNAALAMVKQYSPDLLILDIMIPGIDGFEVCKELKRGQETRNIPVIMLTAKGEEVDRIVGLELGADDYMVKPFSPRELILRVRAILRRGTAEAGVETVWQQDGMVVDFEGHKLTVDGEEVLLTATEFKLLKELIRNPGKVQTRDRLLDSVWAYRFDGYARTVDTHVRRLRQKLGLYSDRVETVRGVGYRFRG
jgi:two-component system, OmpR family, phosphate regulon response regulator PhoB